MSVQLDQQLQLYKTPAIIRDVKQVFLYVQAFSNTTTTSPLRIFTNAGRQYMEGTWNAPVPANAIVPDSVPPYYMPIGTKRRFRIWEQVNNLLDVRIPQDKYMYEISLVEAQIESDPTNYSLQRNLVGIKDDTTGKYTVNRTYDTTYEYGAVPTTNGETQNIEKIYFQEARRQTTPQPLFVRIPQYSNGEPYNWTVVNNGATNDDKSHNVIIRHGQVGFQELDLEFGHLTFQGVDNDYAVYGADVIDDPNTFNFNVNNTAVKGDINNYQNYKYLDYNWEWNNQEKVISDIDTNPNEDAKFLAPLQRAEGFITDRTGFYDGAGATGDIILRDKPLKFNQQVSNILFRFSIKLIHLF